MKSDEQLRFGTHSAKVEQVLTWIGTGELLCFGGSLPSDSIPIGNLPLALEISQAQGTRTGEVDWTELREQQDSMLYEVGLLDSPAWLPFKPEIQRLVEYIGDAVEASLPNGFREIVDDVIADLASCALAVAVTGELDDFHELLWAAYVCGGWPCGCQAEKQEGAIAASQRRLFVLWMPERSGQHPKGGHDS